MLVLITYDVNTETAAGKKRLRKVAKKCVDHGQRVQNSVFECLLTAAQYVTLKAELTALIEPETDSLRFYRLGNQYKQNVEHVGVQPAYAQDSVLLIRLPAVRSQSAHAFPASFAPNQSPKFVLFKTPPANFSLSAS